MFLCGPLVSLLLLFVGNVAVANEPEASPPVEVYSAVDPDEPDDYSNDPAIKTLPPIVVHSTPGERLTAGAALPYQQVKPAFSSGTGSLHGDLEKLAPLPVLGSTQAGSLSQFRGQGRTVDETSVQVMGVPLYFPQGGGTDFSLFPNYLWSGARYRTGSAWGAYDSRGVNGLLSLRLWSDAAVDGAEGQALRWTVNHATSGVTQVAVGGSGGSEHTGLAAIIGFSDGKMRGPAGAATAKVGLGRWGLAAHVLGTSIDSDLPNWSVSGGASVARQQSRRVIPLLVVDRQESDERWFSLQSYFDFGYLRYLGESSADTSETRTWQWGGEAASRWDSWKLSAGYRRVLFRQSSSWGSQENQGRVQLGYERTWGAWLGEIAGRLAFVSGFSVSPEATGSVSYHFNPALRAYSRIGSVAKFPTLVDRYFIFTGYAPNPQLLPERQWQWAWGLDHRLETRLHQNLELAAQWISQAQVFNGTSVQNQGAARSFGLTYQGSWTPGWNHLDLALKAALSFSRVDATAGRYPLLPGWMQTVELGYAPPWSGMQLRGFVAGKLLTLREDAQGQLPSYGLFDVGLAGRIWQEGLRSASLALQLENLLNRRAESIRGILLMGRIFSIAVNAQL